MGTTAVATKKYPSTNQQPTVSGVTLRLFTFWANLLSSPLMRSSYPSSDDSSLAANVLRDLLRFLSTAGAFGIGLSGVGRGGSGATLTARTVLLADEPLLSAEACRCVPLAAGRIVLELSSEMFPVDVLGGDNFRGDAGVFFFGESGGRGGMVGGERRSKPPSKSLSQSSSSVVGGVWWLPM